MLQLFNLNFLRILKRSFNEAYNTSYVIIIKLNYYHLLRQTRIPHSSSVAYNTQKAFLLAIIPLT